ncbi:hypothetical protein GCM10009799_32850 [Nocardiopsis rhodophaea]|uniref:Transposase IS30-like HTH domain-containing protein n=1 Tax=Nocardiopsis rhodophaea TaxID=280238 RepID=A0ABP5ERB8_9ACTN
MRSPGRPTANAREDRRRSWARIADGLSSEDATAACGVSTPVGSRWFREAGGMPPMPLATPCGRYLSFVEREEIALLKAENPGVPEISCRVGRDPWATSRELPRNSATRGRRLEYRASVAQWHA